jgi:hypothetical protein
VPLRQEVIMLSTVASTRTAAEAGAAPSAAIVKKKKDSNSAPSVHSPVPLSVMATPVAALASATGRARKGIHQFDQARMKQIGHVLMHDGEWLVHKAVQEEQQLQPALLWTEKRAEDLDLWAFRRHPMMRYAVGGVCGGLFVAYVTR